MVKKQTTANNMSKPKFSIIVPVYQAEKFIVRCIDSILQQTCKDWELILIDDGSPDKSGAICDEYAAKDERIRVFHQKNSGVSTARNKGLDVMNGNYVLFIDSDDWIDINCLEFCMNEMSRTKADILQFPAERTSKQNNDTVPCTIDPGRTYTTNEYIEANEYFVCIGGTVVLTDIIKTNNIRFRNDIKLAEDQMFIMDCMRFSELIYRSDNPFYKYFVNENSATVNSKSETMIESICALTSYKKTHPQYKGRIDITLLYFTWYIVNNNDIKTKYVYKLIKNADIARNKRFSWIENIFVVLGKISPALSIIFLRLYKSIKR